jgi:uncharacterized protein
MHSANINPLLTTEISLMSLTSFVTFNGDTRLAARIHRSNADLTVRQPAVIVTGSWLTVKEQMADLYAAALAEHGYTAITFDFAGFGASGGTPRQLEVPARKIRDIKAVVDAVSTLSFVQPGGPGYLAICASAQYALAAIAQGAGIASFAAVAGWFHDLATVTPFYGGPDGIAARLVRATEATDHYLATGDVRTVGEATVTSGRSTTSMKCPHTGPATTERGCSWTWITTPIQPAATCLHGSMRWPR